MNSDGHEFAGLTRMARVEVVVAGEQVEVVRELVLEAGASGYTIVPGVAGFGHHGFQQGRLLFNDRDGLSLVMTVVPLDAVGDVVGAIRRLLDAHAGVVFVSETHVSRPEYFQAPDDPS